jgi:hypothetical protein
MSFTPNQVKDELWRRGELARLKLHKTQLRMYESFHNASSLKVVINSSRRLGKSYLLCLIAIETALKTPNSLIRFAAPTGKALKKITIPIFKDILKDCPIEITPDFKSQENVFTFYNGSEIHLSGCNNGHEENLRGQTAHLCLVDEAGFITDLEYVIDDILLPQLISTQGKLIMASTPPRTPAHPFSEYCQKASLENCYSKYTIYDSTYDPSIIEKFKEEAGGENSTTWKREYLVEFVVDENYALVPEWDDKYIQEIPFDEHYRFYLKYVFLDIGIKDLTVALLAYYDFKRAQLIFLDEIVMNGPQMTTDRLAERIKIKEGEHFKGYPVSKRIGDNNNLLLLNDLTQLHNLPFTATNKDSLEAMVNELRMWVKQGRIIVSPNCKQLIGCFKFGVWNTDKKQFDRSKSFGHFDALAAAIYGVRNIDPNFNPIPQNFGVNPSEFFIKPSDGLNRTAKEIKKAFLGSKY